MTAIGQQTFPIFDAVVMVDGRRFDIQIMGLGVGIGVLGLDIISHYKLTIDWSANPKEAIAEDRP